MNLKKHIKKTLIALAVQSLLINISCSLNSELECQPLLVYVPGSTVIGSSSFQNWNSSEYAGVFTEGTQSEIKGFFISRYETTKGEFKAIMSDPGLNTAGITPDPTFTTHMAEKYVLQPLEFDSMRPVENITWFDAVYYCNLLSKKNNLNPVYTITNIKTTKSSLNGDSIINITSADVTQDLSKNGFRLPTAKEWEYSARGGNPSCEEWYWEYSGSKSEVSSPRAIDKGMDKTTWYSYNICNNGVTGSEKCKEGTFGFGPHQVGRKQPNRLGLYDMTGNIEEWCTDGEYSEYVNPATGISEGWDQYYYLKGGCWSFYANYNAIGHRFKFLPKYSNQRNGFRVCRNAGF